MSSIRKIMITGGHPSPALAVIDRLKETHPDTEVVFVGRKYNNQYENSESFEYQEIQSRNIRFIHLDAGRVTRIFSIRSMMSLLQVPLGFIQAFWIVMREKPDTILTFGGYIGFPVALVGKLFGIPIFTHEQTIHPGMANAYISHLSKKTFISFPQSQSYFSKNSTVLTGNPVRKSIFDTHSSTLKIDSNIPSIYITGGSLGSHAINVLIEQIVRKLVETYTVIHQTGNILEFGDFERLQTLRSSLPQELQQRYILRRHIPDVDVGYVYAKSDIVIGRSGANTWFELVALKKPAILIPLPWSAYDEQKKQALLLADCGAAEMFDQSGKSSDLLELIHKILDNKIAYETSYQKLSEYTPSDVSDRIIQEIYR
ncbi:MAG: UDP-N-acetylglucosamine--N-acetylmuramyl-(pentapeptide) pyrophosphoryl-undecaprenol N-acetylglucosamine transferase [Candidatus Roizmanbacteria bacterium]|nr:UDP-N-acetylglucosamine--N-acetylmuramyl-(pentapeptide) pyrophosphoryl-undecaprenol N-acetylglucosamine transferase [Candidatus Roizmanbacteria bacterium]